MSFVAILPSIYPEWTDRCLTTMGAAFTQGVIVRDNTVDNIGVAASWNLGIDEMHAADADWLVIVSAAVRFGQAGGDDFLAQLDGAGSDVIAVEAGHGIGWHLIAFPRQTIERVGRFDEAFFAYCEDLDYGKRCSLAYGAEPPYWNKVSVDVAIAGFAHGIDLGKVDVRSFRPQAIYECKWGGPSGGKEQFTRPYDDPSLDWTFTGCHARLNAEGLCR